LVTQLPIVAAGSAGSELSVEQDGGAYVRRSILPGGVRVLTEKIPGMRSAAIGAWVGAGSRDESTSSFGASHYLEHLLFKGTTKRTAKEIAQVFDAAGGEANAVTGKEHTCYYARVLDKDVPLAVDVIADMITSPLLEVTEFERERGVILEELSMHADDPTDLAFESFTESIFHAHPLGRPIAGTPEEIRKMEHHAIDTFYRAHYSAPALVITAAGGVDHEVVCDLVTKALVDGGWDLDAALAPNPRRNNAGIPPAQDPSAAITLHRPGEQANLIMGGRGISANDPRRYALSVLHALFGAGMSSRLFQKVREDLGLAYSIHSFSSGYADAGSFGIYAGCAVENATVVLELIQQEWDRLIRDGVLADELAQAIGQVSGGLVLGLEDSGARMSRLGRAELTYGELASVEDTLARIAAVTADDVVSLADELATSPTSYTAVGPFEEDIAVLLNSRK